MGGNDVRREASMMRIDELVAERESVDFVTFTLPDADIITRYEALYTGLVSDVLREHRLLNQALPGYLIPLRPERTVAGFAFTVKSAPNVLITGEMDTRTRMLGEMTPNAFVVWDASGDTAGTMWGGVMTATAMRLGVRAAAIAGGIRDTAQIVGSGFPVFYRYRSPNGSLGRCQISHYQIPVMVGDTMVKPGDLVVGDMDGVVVVPRALVEDVLARAEEMHRAEMQIFDWVAQGDSITEITERGGYF